MTEPLFVPRPDVAATSRMGRFLAEVRPALGPAADWNALHAWSVREPEAFWRSLFEHLAPASSGSPDPALVGTGVADTRFFPKVKLSYAENLLHYTGQEPAILACDESGEDRSISRDELRSRVKAVAATLARHGVGPGDRVVAVAGNRIETVVACLAATALGATWSSCAPDMGIAAMRERFTQVAPKVLFWQPVHVYQGVRTELTERVRDLLTLLPQVQLVVALTEPVRLDAPVRQTDLAELARVPAEDFEFPRFAFDHPLFVLFSSGTTGAPKCIVHGAGGTLLTHRKEHALHCDLGPGDRLYFQTSCGWMMWNWLVSALASGVTIVLYDGSPTWPKAGTPWRIVERFAVTAFGTSPAYLAICRGLKLVPKEKHALGSLRMVLSTGSVLSDALFRWIADHVRADLPIASISGGTDIVGCFLLGNPLLPVHAGELQSKSLGLDVRCLDPDTSGQGELVCATPFPSRPVGFLADEGGSKYHAAYYAQNPGYWTHGDLLEVTATGFRIHGRSDGVMNIHGVRIGPGEIYKALEAVPEVKDALAVEMRVQDQSQLVLLVVLAQGSTLDATLAARIKKTLKDTCSSTHVPAKLAQVSGLPYTHSGKKSERAVRDVLAGRAIVNLAALRNPETLEEIRAALLGAPRPA